VKKSISLMLSVLTFSLAVTLIDAFVHPDYALKIPLKILFFLALPLLFFALNKEGFSDFKTLFVFRKKGLFQALVLGVFVYAVIFLGFVLLRNHIDFSRVTSSLTDGMGITADNFVYVALYISLMNSFLEEFFFRGFGFITLKRYASRFVAYLFNSSLFAIYHVGMLVGMFDIGALALLLTGLIVGGCLFSYLNEKNGTIYPSWFVHMFANFAINTVGFILFGVV